MVGVFEIITGYSNVDSFIWSQNQDKNLAPSSSTSDLRRLSQILEAPFGVKSLFCFDIEPVAKDHLTVVPISHRTVTNKYN